MKADDAGLPGAGRSAEDQPTAQEPDASGDETAGPVGDAIAVDRAPHITAGFDGKIELCRAAVLSNRSLHYVGHYSGGVFDFGVDVLGHSTLRTDQPLDLRRRLYRSTGRQLGFKVGSLDRVLEDARTGRIIRTVLHTEGGVMYSYSVKPGEYVVALAFATVTAARSDTLLLRLPAVRDADMAASELTTDLRRQLSLGPENPGGWLTEQPADPLRPSPATVRPAEAPATEQMHRAGDDDTGIAEQCGGALDPEELAYVAHYGDDTGSFALDVFDHLTIARYFTHISPSARRIIYGEVGRQFKFLAGQLSQLVRPLFTGRLLRVVLDVEQGAVYYYRLRPGRYLVGLTLNQDRVSQGDRRMAQLAANLSK